MRNWLGFPTLSGSYSKKFSIRPVNSVRAMASSSPASARGLALREQPLVAQAQISKGAAAIETGADCIFRIISLLPLSRLQTVVFDFKKIAAPYYAMKAAAIRCG